MLVHLSISNFAIIKDLDISFKPGLTIISGETGTGKSIIISAINLILGSRASAELIRTGCGRARVEALFHFPESAFLKEVLDDMGLPFDDELLIKRSIYREGRNRIMINGSMATLQMLSVLAGRLISISGQHENQRLLKPENHLFFLDDFGGLNPDREALGEVFSQYLVLYDDIRKRDRDIREIEERQELNRFQLQEIDAASIQTGEDESLEAEKKRLRHAEELMDTVGGGYQVLYERNDSVLSSVSQCVKGLTRASAVDGRLEPVCRDLSEIEARIEDVSFVLRELQKSIFPDPNRLEAVMERLDLLNRLKRKYGPALAEVLAFRDNLATGMEDLEEKRRIRQHLSEKRGVLEARIRKRASVLSKKRKKAAQNMEKAMERELQSLHMENTRFEIAFQAALDAEADSPEALLREVRADGFDRVEFMFSPNVGEAPKPLARIASGGELSRSMLAMKTILAKRASVETVIFDEVDAGISGATAEVVGEKLAGLSAYHQLLCITHLPQIASQGGTQYVVTKKVVDGRTQTLIRELDEEERVQEIARLLGGKEITRSAVDHARQMLNPHG